jgi:hypothetical protein
MRTSDCFPKPTSLVASICVIITLLSLPNVSRAGLLGYWSFEEGSGTTTADMSGNGLTGTLSGATLPAWVTPGAVGSGALDFTPIAAPNSEKVDIGNPPSLNLTGSYLTLSAWAFPRSVSDGGRIVTKGGGSNNRGWSLGVESTGIWRLQIASGVNALTSCSTANGTVALNTWTHIAGVYDGVAGTMKLYINGVEATTTLSAAVPAFMSNPVNVGVGIGSRNDGSGITRWNGMLDEVRIYDQALTPNEIMALVPEPSTLALGLALAAMVGLRRFGRVS